MQKHKTINNKFLLVAYSSLFDLALCYNLP